jgi:hypothetical protein
MRLFIIGIIFISTASVAQIGNPLKGLKRTQVGRFVTNKGVDLLSKELRKTREKFDTASFSYSISLSDKAARFDNKENYKDVVTVSSMMVKSNEPKTPLDEAREYLDVGEMAYAANGFK